MKTIIKKGLQGILLVPALALAVGSVAPLDVSAQSLQDGINATGVDTQDVDEGSLVLTITNWFLFVVGAIAVIMLIFGGFKYITSGGDASNVTSAKNTILYAVIGLVVVVLAGTIVNFVVVGLLEGPTAG